MLILLRYTKSLVEAVIHISFTDFVELFDTVNESVRKIANNKNIQLIDLDVKIPKEREYIYDMVHFTDKGSDIAAEYIANELIDKVI